ncbi:MAG: stage II sporulation protein R, partial [Eubacterium sp.]|nr:stage II sporulation protein R [Eubacterium sp.]
MKIFKIFVPVFLLLIIVTSCITPDITSAESISDKVLRLHILANSDSSEDQNIKLGLKNYFLDHTKELFIGKTIEENVEIAENSKEQIENICNSYLKNYGKTAFVTVEKEFFNTRVYDDFTLP